MKWRIIISIICILSTGLVAQINFSDSNLPIFVIDTDSFRIMDEPKANAHLGVIYNENNRRNSLSDDFNHYDGQIGIELRGATSQALFEKKGYALETRLEDETNNNIALLGLAKENDWVLHGPYSDKTLMRNALAYCIAGKLVDYAPGIRFVELVVNDDYKGVYLLTEKIKRDKGRVDISKLTSDIKDGEALTGGYILKIDKSEGGQTDGFFSQLPAKSDGWQETFYQYHYPKPRDINQEQKDYIEFIVDEIDQTFSAESFKDPNGGFRKLLDEDSAIDYLIINELSKNPDAYRLSTYLFKDRDSIDTKVHFGPVWDYNLAFGNVNYCTGGNHEGFVVREFNETCPDDYWQINFWWDKMLSDTLFVRNLKERWFYLRESILSESNLHTKVDSFANLLVESQIRNFKRYPILEDYVWPNYTIENSYGGEVFRLKTWITKRLNWIDNNISLIDLPEYDPALEFEPIVLPNPVIDNSVIRYYASTRDLGYCIIYNLMGQKVFLQALYKSSTRDGFNELEIPPNLQPGIYFYKIIVDEVEYGGKFEQL